MWVIDWMKLLLRKTPPAQHPEPENAEERQLREFVYLDEVSLRSLLSSQKGEVTETKSEQAIDTTGRELHSTIGVQSPIAGKAEVASRFQTTNSSTLQTSRKATVQSWFRELHDMTHLRLIEPVQNVQTARNVDDLAAIEDRSVVASSDDLTRGTLVEFRVRLNADPVFRLGTLVSEFTGMAEDYADMFAEGDTLATLGEAHRINKILQRLLAGLIPVRAEAVDHVCVSISGTEYLVHQDVVADLDIETHRLQIVGVTEHLAYWKDIRRVLFSNAEFTMLCRISRAGLQPSWVPVKLADMFREVAPDLVEQINAAGRTPLSAPPAPQKPEEDPDDMRLFAALRHYRDALLADWGIELSEAQAASIEDFILGMGGRGRTVTGQKHAFAALAKLLSAMLGKSVEGMRDLELRENARHASGLPFFSFMNGDISSKQGSAPVAEEADPPRLLDVEVVAIYW